MQPIKKLFTLVFVRRDTEILLGMKKRGFGVGKWNGFGGKLEPGETIVAAAARELYEESEVRVIEQDLRNIGHLQFTFEGEPQIMEVCVYSTETFEGIPTETEEMRPRWFKINQIPFEEMWPDDPLWFPYMFENKLFFGKFHYRGLTEILSYDIRELESMEKFYREHQCEKL